MKVRRKGRPYNPALGQVEVIHDRIAKDRLRNAMIGIMLVDDPFCPGEKIAVARSIRNDPLGRLHDRKQVDEAQYRAGRKYQEDFERAECGPRAIDPGKEAVDGGMAPDPLPEAMQEAIQRLAKVHKLLGPDGSAIVSDVLTSRLSMEAVANKRGLTGERWRKYFGMRFDECLHRLSYVYGFASEGTGKVRA